jgi:hypothetical protein
MVPGQKPPNLCPSGQVSDWEESQVLAAFPTWAAAIYLNSFRGPVDANVTANYTLQSPKSKGLAVSEFSADLCSDGALQTTHDIWENWAAGASHAGDSFSLGLQATRGYWGPPIHNMGSCGRFGEIPNTWKHFGPEPTQVLNSVISVLLRQGTATWGGLDLGSDGVWDRDYGWGVRVCRHFGARGVSSVRYGTRLVCVFITAVPNTKLCAWGEEDSGGHVL